MSTLKDADVFLNRFFDCVYDILLPPCQTLLVIVWPLKLLLNIAQTGFMLHHYYCFSMVLYTWYTSYILLTLHNKVKQVFLKAFGNLFLTVALITKQYKTLLTNNRHQKVNLAKVLFECFRNKVLFTYCFRHIRNLG